MLELFVKYFVLGPEARDEKGATATEYALLVALIALAIVLAVGAFGGFLSDFFAYIGNTVDGWTS